MKTSLFTKILLSVIVTGALIIFAVYFSLRFIFSPPPGMRHAFKKTISLYSELVVKEIGFPPNIAVSEALAKEYSLGIRVEKEGRLVFTTDPEIPSIDQLVPWEPEPSKHQHSSKMGGRPFQIIEKKIGADVVKYAIFAPARGKPFEPNWEYVPLLLIGLVAIIAGCYAVIRRLLRPINDLTTGVAEIRKGNLRYQVPQIGSDELGELAESFNRMTERIGEMIRDKEQLIIDVSHEMRSPLTRMKIALEFVQSEKTRKDIQEQADEMEKMINQILEAARMTNQDAPLKLEKVNLGALVREVTAKFASSYPTIGLKSIDDSLMVDVDKEKMKTAIKNIVENAMKYSSSQSTVEVSVVSDGGRPQVVVKDFGCGIPASEIGKVFEPFYRVDKSRSRETGGFGLGLSLCRKIMRAHGGEVRLESVEGKGTTATLALLKP